MPDGQPPLDLFVGREAEVSRVAEIVARVEAGQPWLVAIEGDPGMGKTALARRCLTGAAGLRVLSARADQAEADLDFGDYLGMADALGPWQDEATLDGRSRTYAVLWRPLLAEQAAVIVDQLQTGNGQVSFLQPALAWLDGWLAELRGLPEEALRIYSRGEDTGSSQSPVHTARLLLAHGRLLRRTGG